MAIMKNVIFIILLLGCSAVKAINQPKNTESSVPSLTALSLDSVIDKMLQLIQETQNQLDNNKTTTVTLTKYIDVLKTSVSYSNIVITNINNMVFREFNENILAKLTSLVKSSYELITSHQDFQYRELLVSFIGDLELAHQDRLIEFMQRAIRKLSKGDKKDIEIINQHNDAMFIILQLLDIKEFTKIFLELDCIYIKHLVQVLKNIQDVNYSPLDLKIKNQMVPYISTLQKKLAEAPVQYIKLLVTNNDEQQKIIETILSNLIHVSLHIPITLKIDSKEEMELMSKFSPLIDRGYSQLVCSYFNIREIETKYEMVQSVGYLIQTKNIILEIETKLELLSFYQNILKNHNCEWTDEEKETYLQERHTTSLSLLNQQIIEIGKSVIWALQNYSCLSMMGLDNLKPQICNIVQIGKNLNNDILTIAQWSEIEMQLSKQLNEAELQKSVVDNIISAIRRNLPKYETETDLHNLFKSFEKSSEGNKILIRLEIVDVLVDRYNTWESKNLIWPYLVASAKTSVNHVLQKNAPQKNRIYALEQLVKVMKTSAFNWNDLGINLNEQQFIEEITSLNHTGACGAMFNYFASRNK